jgi:diguanylate cyclase (GGDEF)-like protein/PAS domain S-box-containing protein
LDILVVDPDPRRAEARGQALQAHGHRVSRAQDGAGALSALRETTPHVVLCELGLPDMDGAELCARVRKDERHAAVGVVVVLGIPGPTELKSVLEAGADDFLVAPVEDELMVLRVGAVAARARSRVRPGGGTQDPAVTGGQRRAESRDVVLGACTLLLQRDAALARARAAAQPPPGEPPAPVASIAQQVFDSTAEGIVVTDLEGSIVAVNDAQCRITGCTREELLGRNPRVLKSDRHPPEFYRRMWADLMDQGRWQGEVWDRRKDGEVYPKWLTINVIRDDAGTAQGFVGVASDVGAIKNDVKELERLAHYDVLTGLPNRVLFMDRMRQAVSQADRGGRGVALLFIDLDGFGAVNNNLGHRAGDLLLELVAKRVSGCLRLGDTFARLAGDEFTVVIPDVADANSVAPVARKILDAVAAPFKVEEHDVNVTASVGVAVFPQDAADPEELLKRADTAMYHAKKGGKNRYHFYSPEIHTRAVARMAMETDLRRALATDELVPFYQPRVDAKTGMIHSVEAVLRWPRKGMGTVPPSRFIPVAEESRLILEVDDWVLRAACRQQRAWAEAGLRPIRMAVNMSPASFERPKLVDKVAAILIETGVDPHSLELEITEGTAMRDPDAAISTLLDLKAIGIHVALDDFGTGYSALSYLRRLPVDMLKIDRSFVRDLPNDQSDSAITSAIISVGHSLGLAVVAEGVETKGQVRFLRTQRCDFIQGFLASKPVPAEQATALLKADASLLPL